MRRRGRARDRAGHLAVLDPLGQRRERLRRIVAGLQLQAGPVDGAAIEAGRGPGLQPPEREPDAGERRRQTQRRRLADAAGRNLPLADMDQPAKKCPRRQHQSAGAYLAAIGEPDTHSFSTGLDQIVDLGLDHAEIRRLRDRPLHRRRVERPVGLRARSAHGGTLAPVEHAELDSRRVRDPAHEPVERVDLAHQVSLAEPADRRIARHGADGGEAMRDQRRARAEPRRGRGRFAARVPAADDDDVETLHHFLQYARSIGAESVRQSSSRERCFT